MPRAPAPALTPARMEVVETAWAKICSGRESDSVTVDELKTLGNSIGMGAMGFMGSSMVVDAHIEVGYCHTGGMPMSVHMFCLSSRRATARLYADGRVEFRTDPEWFTDYMRRSTVEWEAPQAQDAAE